MPFRVKINRAFSLTILILQSVMDVFHQFSDLPEDIGRTIFEAAAEAGNGPACAIVSRRIQSWCVRVNKTLWWLYLRPHTQG